MNSHLGHSGASSLTDPPEAVSGFPGHGEAAPLDLSGLTATDETAIAGRLRDGSFGAWADTAAAVGYCARPVRLVGTSTSIDAATGEVLDTFSSAHTPLGVVYRACGNRRAEVCPACSRVYARDTFAMIRAGLVGGKTVPESVADNPLLFVTFTAPSFGHVHGLRPRPGNRAGKNGANRAGGRCRPRTGPRDHSRLCRHGRPTGCMAIHGPDDPANGAPLCPECYDWTSAVVWQWWAPELWRRTTIALRRALATHLGVPERRLGALASLQYAKVAEHQARGMIHFHALIRLDGPDGPGSPAPLDAAELSQALGTAARVTTYTAPPVDHHDRARVLAWGRQLDVRIVRTGHGTDDPAGPLTAEQVAGYLAKYATKDATSVQGAPGDTRPHLRRLICTCRDLGKRARAHDPESPYLLLGKWAHMLGFRGHFSTKSRHYSVTLGAIRRGRHLFRQRLARGEQLDRIDLRDLEEQLLAADEETTLVIGSWHYQGTGWPRPGDQTLALAAAARAREHAQWKADQRKNNHSENGSR